MSGKVIKKRESVSFAAAELGGQIKHGAGFGAFTGQPAHDLAGKTGEIFGKLSACEEAIGLLVIGRSGSVANVVEVDGEFGGVEGFPFAEVFARGDNFIPGFKGHLLFSC